MPETGALRRGSVIWALAGLLAASCNAFLPTRVEVKNDGDEVVRNVVVEIAGDRQARKEIRPGRSARFSRYADRDGDIALRYEVKGREVRRRFEYVSRYVSVRCVVAIGRNGDPAIRC
jgi:hypothetical protein